MLMAALMAGDVMPVDRVAAAVSAAARWWLPVGRGSRHRGRRRLRRRRSGRRSGRRRGHEGVAPFLD